MREIDVDKLMTLLTYTGLVLTLATIHEPDHSQNRKITSSSIIS